MHRRVGPCVIEPRVGKEICETPARAPIEKEFFYEKPSFVMDFGAPFHRGDGDTRAWEELLTYCAHASAKAGKKIFPDFKEHVYVGEKVMVLTLPAHCGYNAIFANNYPSDTSYIREILRSSANIFNQLCFIHMTATFLYDLTPVEFGPVQQKRAAPEEGELMAIGCKLCLPGDKCKVHSSKCHGHVGSALIESDP
jgi:hypothetical protein